MPSLENTLTLSKEKNLTNSKEQKNFLETTLGKVINTGLNLGLRVVLPDFIENEVIGIKDTILKEGFGAGIKKCINSAVDLGKSAIGIFTGKFENVSQVQTAIKNGGLIDSLSELLTTAINKAVDKSLLSKDKAKLLTSGKNAILSTIESNIENEFSSELSSIEKLNKYENNWKEYLDNQDFEGMEKEYKKINKELKKIIPLEETLNKAKTIQNLQELIKNNGQDFNLSKEQLKLAEMLT